MPKHIEADAIILTSHDGRCELRLEAGRSHVGLVFASRTHGTRAMVLSAEGGFGSVEFGPDSPAPAAPDLDSLEFRPAAMPDVPPPGGPTPGPEATAADAPGEQASSSDTAGPGNRPIANQWDQVDHNAGRAEATEHPAAE